MKIGLVVAMSAAVILTLPLFTQRTISTVDEQEPVSQLPQLVRGFLESKNSPLAPETDFLMSHKHWRLLIAISAIESQYCKRQLGNNCFGIGGDSAYRYYDSYRESIVDAENLITRWQDKGKWLTVESMNCSYVVPCNPNWVLVVNKILNQLDGIQEQNQK